MFRAHIGRRWWARPAASMATTARGTSTSCEGRPGTTRCPWRGRGSGTTSSSDDKTHDSYAMQCFVAMAIRHLKGDAPGGSGNLPFKQGLTSLCIHSGNAAQHFKSSKSINFFTKQLEGGSGESGSTSITWGFGASITVSCHRPSSAVSQATAHSPPTSDFALPASFAGKGVWGGLEGMLKQWPRTHIVSAP